LHGILVLTVIFPRVSDDDFRDGCNKNWIYPDTGVLSGRPDLIPGLAVSSSLMLRKRSMDRQMADKKYESLKIENIVASGVVT
jgi:hypothetical protein